MRIFCRFISWMNCKTICFKRTQYLVRKNYFWIGQYFNPMLSYFNILTMLSCKYKITWQQYFTAQTPNIKILTNLQHFCKNIEMKKIVKKIILRWSWGKILDCYTMQYLVLDGVYYLKNHQLRLYLFLLPNFLLMLKYNRNLILVSGTKQMLNFSFGFGIFFA